MIPESEAEIVQLESYDCKLFDKESGRCKEYANRPAICKKTICDAFKTDDEKKQKEIIDKIKREKYTVCKAK